MTANATVVGTRPEGPRGRVLSIAVPVGHAAAHHAAGQYCAVEYGGETGWFAIASPRGRAPFEFYVQPGGGSSEALIALEPGANVRVGEPQGGGFELPRVLDDAGPVYLLATGSGVSGVRSSIERLITARRAARLYIGARTAHDLLFATEYAAWRAAGVDVIPVLSRAAPGWNGRRGYVQQALLADVTDLSDAWVVACGQPQMQADALSGAQAAGLRPDRFLTNH